MTGRGLPELTATELAIMKTVWKRGALSAREIHDEVAEELSWAYSTTRTVLERLVKKQMLVKQGFHGLNLYAAKISKAVGLAHFVRQFAEQVAEVDLAPVVNLLSGGTALSEVELAELQAILTGEAFAEDETDTRAGEENR